MPVTKMNVIDVSQLPQHQKDSKILKDFDGLSPGEGLTLIDNVDARYFLTVLQTSRKNSYEWWPLMLGPDDWQIVITKRTETTERTIQDFLHSDHLRLHDLFKDHSAELDVDNMMLASIRFEEFQAGLLRHIRMEEVLIPLYEKKAESTTGPTHLIRMEHEELRGLMKKMVDLLSEAKVEGLSKRDVVRELGKQIQEYLKLHIQNEENILYPSSDQMIQGKERDKLIFQMEAV